MSAAFYNEMAGVARELLADFGATISITRTTGRVESDITGAVTSAGSVATYLPKGILKEYNNMQIDGSKIQTGDKLLVLDDTVLPLMTDKPIVNGKTWNIMDIEIKEPAGIPLVYLVQIRG
jgi:hypothetical protein